MIDWLTVTLSSPGMLAVPAGKVLVIDHEGNTELDYARPAQFVGSFDARIRVSTSVEPVELAGGQLYSGLQAPSGRLRIDGNLTKFLQGHGLWGREDPLWLVGKTLHRLAALGVAPVPVFEIEECLSSARVTRVDITRMFRLDSDQDCQSWIESLSRSASWAHHGRGAFGSSTLYFGKNSRHRSLKFYSKGPEFQKSSRNLDRHLDSDLLSKLQEYARGCVRIEATYRGPALDHRGCSVLSQLSSSVCDSLFHDSVNDLKVGDMQQIVPRVEDFPPRLRPAVLAFLAGHRLQDHMSRATFYRVRRELLGYGINIDHPPASLETARRFVPSLVRVLAPTPADVPGWAVGTQIAKAA